jgi:hypothetical protein
MERQLQEISPAIEITKLDFGEPYDYMSGPISITVEYKVPGYATVLDNEMVFDPVITKGIFKAGMSHLYINTSVEERKYGFRDRCSRLVTLEETIKIPEGYTPVTQEWAESFGDPVASYDGKISFENNTLKLYERITLGKRIYEPADWPMFKKVVQEQKDFADRKIVLINN